MTTRSVDRRDRRDVKRGCLARGNQTHWQSDTSFNDWLSLWDNGSKIIRKIVGIWLQFKVQMTEKVSAACILLACVRKYGPTTCVSASGLVVNLAIRVKFEERNFIMSQSQPGTSEDSLANNICWTKSIGIDLPPCLGGHGEFFPAFLVPYVPPLRPTFPSPSCP